jgi:hypothetical protein
VSGGRWEWACYAAHFLPTPQARYAAVRELVLRHAPWCPQGFAAPMGAGPGCAPRRDFLCGTLGVPEALLDEALGYAAGYCAADTALASADFPWEDLVLSPDQGTAAEARALGLIATAKAAGIADSTAREAAEVTIDVFFFYVVFQRLCFLPLDHTHPHILPDLHSTHCPLNHFAPPVVSAVLCFLNARVGGGAGHSSVCGFGGGQAVRRGPRGEPLAAPPLLQVPRHAARLPPRGPALGGGGGGPRASRCARRRRRQWSQPGGVYTPSAGGVRQVPGAAAGRRRGG